MPYKSSRHQPLVTRRGPPPEHLIAWALGLPERSPRLKHALRALADHAYYLLALGVLALHAGLPLLRPSWRGGHDNDVYWSRIVEFTVGLQCGQLFPRWAPDYNVG